MSKDTNSKDNLVRRITSSIRPLLSLNPLSVFKRYRKEAELLVPSEDTQHESVSHIGQKPKDEREKLQ